MAKRKLTAIQRLPDAMSRCASTRGEAQWTNGYRSGAVGVASSDPDRLYAKEQAQWTENTAAGWAFRRLALKLLREAAKPSRRPRRDAK